MAPGLQSVCGTVRFSARKIDTMESERIERSLFVFVETFGEKSMTRAQIDTT